MMEPPPTRRIAGSTARDIKNGPFRFVARTRSHSSSLILSTVETLSAPALFTRTSIRPKAFSVSSAALRPSSSRVTSAARAMASPPTWLIPLRRLPGVPDDAPKPPPSRLRRRGPKQSPGRFQTHPPSRSLLCPLTVSRYHLPLRLTGVPFRRACSRPRCATLASGLARPQARCSAQVARNKR